MNNSKSLVIFLQISCIGVRDLFYQALEILRSDPKFQRVLVIEQLNGDPANADVIVIEQPTEGSLKDLLSSTIQVFADQPEMMYIIPQRTYGTLGNTIKPVVKIGKSIVIPCAYDVKSIAELITNLVDLR